MPTDSAYMPASLGASDPNGQTAGEMVAEKSAGASGEFPTGAITIERLLDRTPEDGRPLVQKAYEVAARLHEGQVRASGEPFIHHPMMVAWYLADLNMDGASIAAGLMHDVLEDTHMTREQISELFPQDVVDIVQGVTKISRISFQTTREAQMENLRIMIIAMAQDIRVVIVKLCDRLHNMKTLKYLAPEKRQKISQETLDIYAPLANRLGMSKVKTEMEDLAMRWLAPEAYQKLTKMVATKKTERESLVKESIEFMREYLGRSYPNIVITGRPKHFYSIYKKMNAQGLTFDQINDLNAIRIICENDQQCYEILGLVHAVWHPVMGRFKDYIGMPKKNMYQSLHTTVIGYKGARTEIQIRTKPMHHVAEYGIAAHWKYKEQLSSTKMEERLSWLRQITEWITEVSEPGVLLDALKQDVFADRVMCFTPKGDVIELPANATPIDFAYAIHTRVGEKCVGAKINDRIVNLRATLQNGDGVDVLTSPNGHPSRDWLDYAKTGRARQKIKHWLKDRNASDWAATGRRAIEAILHERHLHINQHDLDAALATLLPVYKLQNIDDLLVEVGFGTVSAAGAIARMNPDWVKRPEKEKKPTKPGGKRGPIAPKVKARQTGPIIVDEMGDLPIRLAACCHPIPGDPIVAFITRGRGLTIHHKDCRSVIKAGKDPQEAQLIHPAQWNMDGGATHTVVARIVADDKSGLLNEMSGIFSRHGIFINGCLTKSDRTRGTAILQFEINVRDAVELDRVLNDVKNTDGVISAERRKKLDIR
ncbi:bifunctional (p)ppGpp synthetase/guanosine-3',5'-bis(diphosphate) 3'-pyrophosphohydrolase [soil metagenome]